MHSSNLQFQGPDEVLRIRRFYGSVNNPPLSCDPVRDDSKVTMTWLLVPFGCRCIYDHAGLVESLYRLRTAGTKNMLCELGSRCEDGHLLREGLDEATLFFVGSLRTATVTNRHHFTRLYSSTLRQTFSIAAPSSVIFCSRACS